MMGGRGLDGRMEMRRRGWAEGRSCASLGVFPPFSFFGPVPKALELLKLPTKNDYDYLALRRREKSCTGRERERARDLARLLDNFRGIDGRTTLHVH